MSFVSTVLSAVLGLTGGVTLTVTGGGVRLARAAVIGFFRAIPALMLIFWVFFLMPVLLHIDVPGPTTLVCALALIGGAYLSHSVQAGLAAIGTGQRQAAAPGMTRWQVLHS
ncbi:hypothetical protein LMG29542_06252 [Paraburkholderia humisilvae]|uniref:ABC transmembrane type-1 domain-containing protein n=1 Tax=Paraburkholderia humisilvae TaxID=627669 RepID=A0A6J5EU01_9BURK|nr:hypothetical protein LMG29542_06252 [Paraburkholderia humisilvae]